MTERLLQYIWQLQYFNGNNLFTGQGDKLQIIYPGIFNSNQGPDFLEGKIRINGDLWAGNIELHLKTSDWKKHAHHKDGNYKNVILHVVWENDMLQSSMFNLPTFELRDRVSGILMQRYGSMMNQQSFIPCGNSLKQVPLLVLDNWKDRMLIERLQRKALQVNALLLQNNYHWEEVLWWMLARNFGMKVNAEAFEEVAKSIPFHVLTRHRNQIHQAEAFLFGQAGLLNKKFSDPYPLLLQREYRFLKNKYQLTPAKIPVLFLRMRPQGFPSVRLAQLAMFLCNSNNLFSFIRECDDLKKLKTLLRVTANDYWNYHYLFDEDSGYSPKVLGDDTIHSIIINTVIPVLYCYGAYHGVSSMIEKAIRWAGELPAEKNMISRGWAKAGIIQKTAACTQAFLELKTVYCDKKRCLDCAIGHSILKNPSGSFFT